MLQAQVHALAVRQRLQRPSNAVPDRGIKLVNGRPVEPTIVPIIEECAEAKIVPIQRPMQNDPATFEEIEAEIERLKKKMADMRLAAGLAPARRLPEVKAIKVAVARRYGVTVIDIDSARRTASVVRPRQIAMYLTKILTLRSLPDIGRLFGNRDHTTALHAIRKIGELRLVDSELDANVAALAALLKPAE